MKRSFASLVTAISLVSACGGSNDSAPSSSAGGEGDQPTVTPTAETNASFVLTGDGTVISGIAVPPPPADREVNATSAGIDKNGNGVRDDVERLLATAYGADAKAFAGAMKMAARMQTILAPTSIDRDTVQAIVVAGVNDARCNTDANFKGNLLAASRANQVVMAAALNTVERVALYQARLSLASAVVPIDVQKACS